MSSDSELHKIKAILEKIGIPTVFEIFKKEKIDLKVAVSLSDNELIRLGITTIGDRVRFRDMCQREINTSECATTSASTSSAANHSSSRGSQNQRERAHLFNIRSNLNASGSRSGPTRKKEGRKRTWTGNFLCLDDRHGTRVPSANEKQIVQKAGLGIKKIPFEYDDDEKAVVEKITSDWKVGDTGTCIYIFEISIPFLQIVDQSTSSTRFSTRLVTLVFLVFLLWSSKPLRSMRRAFLGNKPGPWLINPCPCTMILLSA